MTRGALGAFLFLAGLSGGAFGYAAFHPGPAASPYGTLAQVEEPAASRTIVQALANDDARTLAAKLDSDRLTALQTAIEPLQEVTDTKFLGAVQRAGHYLAAYSAKGKDSTGTTLIRGFVLQVENDAVVGVN